MILDGLFNLVNELRERIETHGGQLRSNEMQTRYALIDPLLRELGWDTSDPALVTPEYSASGGRADYALLSDGRPVVMVEAKRLGEDLGDPAAQGARYSWQERTPYFTVTNGRRWEIYYFHNRDAGESQWRVSFDMVLDTPAAVCLKSLSLWRPAVLSSAPTVVFPQPPEPNSETFVPEWKPIATLDFSTLATNDRGTPIALSSLSFQTDSATESVLGQTW